MLIVFSKLYGLYLQKVQRNSERVIRTEKKAIFNGVYLSTSINIQPHDEKKSFFTGFFKIILPRQCSSVSAQY